MTFKKVFFLVVSVFLSMFMGTQLTFAETTIVEEAPPIDVLFEPVNNVGAGAIVPLAQFRLSQPSGTDTVTKIGLQIIASSTIDNGEISRVSLWQESGASPGFQIDQDTFVIGAASTSPMVDGTQITLTPTTAISVGSSATQFYVIASTTLASGITNTHAFNVAFQANYASTSAAGFAVGIPFSSNKKVVLNQSAPLKISEIKLGASGNTEDEFIELYNSGSADINLSDIPLNLYLFNANGGAQKKTLSYVKKIIPGYGFFLIGSATNYSGSVPLDATYDTITSGQFTLAINGGLSIATSSTLLNATSSKIDLVCWGAQPSANCEDTDTMETTNAPLNLQDGRSMERIAEGYPNATSTNLTMAQGGADAGKGNGKDRDDNSAEFVIQTIPGAQNSTSPEEFPFGGGGQDMSSLQVQGTFPGTGQVNVPVDQSFIGFTLNKTVSSSTIASLSATTTVTLTAAGSMTNLCTSVSYNPFPGSFEPQAKCNLSASLAPNTVHTFTVSGVRDLSGNFLDQNGFQAGNQSYSSTFTTGAAGQTMTNVTPPSVVGTSPFRGSANIPRNLSTIAIEFNQGGMDLSTFTASNITLSGGITLSAFSFSTSTSKNILTATLSGTLAANTTYTLTVGTGVRSSNGVALPFAYTTTFTTSGVSDLTAPTIVGVIPTNGATISPNTNDFVFSFDDNIDTTTATSGAITLSVTGGSNLPVSVSYLPVAKEGHIIPNNVLPVGQELTLTLRGASIKNVSGVLLGSDVTKTWTVVAVNSDVTPPSLISANADDFSVAISFNEAINQTDALSLANYSLTVGGVAQTLSALAGQTLTYDATTRTVKLTGIRTTAGAQFVVTASNIRDISGNAMTSASSFTGTVASFAQSGGNIGPGSFSGSTFGEMKDFSASGIGFMPPVNIRPQSTFINSSTTYAFELPIAKQIPANGTIVITFPSSSDFALCCVATTSSKNPMLVAQNADINGPGGTAVGIKTIASDATAKTVTITLDNATRSENSDTHDFLRFTIADIKNPSIPKGIDSSGYILDIKSKSDGTILESFSANPVYIGGGTAGGGSVTTIRGVVSGNSENLQDVTVRLMSPQTGPLEAVTDANGLYQFTDIPVGSQFLSNNFGGGNEYMLFIDPFISGVSDSNGATTTNFIGNTMPSPVLATSTSIITKNFALTPVTAGSIAANFTVRLSAAADTFTASETVDVFAGGPGQFVSRTVTPGTAVLNAGILTTVPIPKVNGSWGVGIGPSMPKGGGFSGPPPSPDWAMPKPIEVKVSGCPSACVTTVGNTSTTSNIFVISTADKTISGVLKDGSGNAIASAMVFAFSPSTDGGGGTGNSTQTSTNGTFSIKVVTGTYIVGAYSPGLGESKKVTVVVDSSGSVFVDGNATASTGGSGANPFTLKMVKPDFTITGQVTDGSSAVGNAPVFAYRTDAPGHSDAMSDSSTGNYTLYVGNGTWKVSSFIPGFGPMAEQTVTVSGSSQSNINFAPSSSQTFSILSGNIYEDTNSNDLFTAGEGLSGAVIRVSNGTNVNEGVSGTDGAYTVRVPSGTGYTIRDIFSPTYGRIAPIGDDGSAIGLIDLTASTTKNIRIPVRGTVNISIKDSNGSPLTVPRAFIDLLDNTTGLGNHVEITDGTTTSMLLASSTSAYTVKAYIQGIPPANISVASDDAGTTVTSGRITINRATEYIKIVVNTASAGMSTISGTVYKDSATSGNELEGAWIQFVDQTNGVQFGTQSTSSGRYSIKALDGSYQVLVSKPQYVGTPTTLAVSGTTTQNMIMTQSSLTISGTISAGGVVAPSSFVRGEKVGGGQSITQADINGTYTLRVTPGVWRVFAAADGYSEGGSDSNPVTVSSSQSSINVSLSTVSSVESKLATSNTFSDTSAGSFSDPTVNLKVNVDANAFGSLGASSYFTAKETTNFPNTTSVNIIGNKAKDISAFSGGSQVTNLASGKTAEVELTYTVAELATSDIDTTTEVGKLTVVSYSADKGDWETLSTVATYKDSAGAVVTSPSADLSNVASVSFIASGTHFSPYALSTAEGVSPPSTPGGLTVTTITTGAQANLSWGSVSDATGYYVYRDTSLSGSFPLLVNLGVVTSYTDNAVSLGTTYYYKVSAYKSSGASESAASDAVSVTTVAAGAIGGGGGGVVSSGGGGGGTSATAVTTTVVATVTTATPVSTEIKPTVALAMPVSVPGPDTIVVGHKFLKVVRIGNSGSEVVALQDVLEAKGFLIMPKGVAKGFFGPLTHGAIKKFQKANNIAKEGQPGYGDFGPKTRAKFNEITAGATSKTTGPSVSSMTPEAKTALIKNLLKQISALQELLLQLIKAGGV